jgi:hypothetical protein
MDSNTTEVKLRAAIDPVLETPLSEAQMSYIKHMLGDEFGNDFDVRVYQDSGDPMRVQVVLGREVNRPGVTREVKVINISIDEQGNTNII